MPGVVRLPLAGCGTDVEIVRTYWPFIACALALAVGFLIHLLVGALKGDQGKE